MDNTSHEAQAEIDFSKMAFNIKEVVFTIQDSQQPNVLIFYLKSLEPVRVHCISQNSAKLVLRKYKDLLENPAIRFMPAEDTAG